MRIIPKNKAKTRNLGSASSDPVKGWNSEAEEYGFGLRRGPNPETLVDGVLAFFEFWGLGLWGLGLRALGV